METSADLHAFEVEIFLNDLDPDAVRGELYADGIDGNDGVREEMKRAGPLAGESLRWDHNTTVSVARPASDYPPEVNKRLETADKLSGVDRETILQIAPNSLARPDQD